MSTVAQLDTQYRARWSAEDIRQFIDVWAEAQMPLTDEDAHSLFCALDDGDPPPNFPRVTSDVAQRMDMFAHRPPKGHAVHGETVEFRDGGKVTVVRHMAAAAERIVINASLGHSTISPGDTAVVQTVSTTDPVSTTTQRGGVLPRLVQTQKKLGSTWSGAGSLRALKRNLRRNRGY